MFALPGCQQISVLTPFCVMPCQFTFWKVPEIVLGVLYTKGADPPKGGHFGLPRKEFYCHNVSAAMVHCGVTNYHCCCRGYLLNSKIIFWKCKW